MFKNKFRVARLEDDFRNPEMVAENNNENKGK